VNIDSKTVIAAIQSDIRAIANNAALYLQTNFDDRADAIDFLDFHLIERLDGLGNGELKGELKALKRQAVQLKSDLEKIDTDLFKQIRKKIKAGIYAKSSFTGMIHQHLVRYFSEPGLQDKIGYDNLDIFLNGLLFDQPLPESTTEREPDMVFYQQTPARIIVELAERVGSSANEVFVDIGSGLGLVAIAVNLITGIKSIAIEYEPAYCNYAKACALQLNVTGVEFIYADAREGDYSEGTIFFLYTPFEGNMLQDVLNILRKASQKKQIRIFTYGPCSAHVAGQNWLRSVNGMGDDYYKLYEFYSLDI
jgi:hypothetical protein